MWDLSYPCFYQQLVFSYFYAWEGTYSIIASFVGWDMSQHCFLIYPQGLGLWTWYQLDCRCRQHSWCLLHWSKHHCILSFVLAYIFMASSFFIFPTALCHLQIQNVCECICLETYERSLGDLPNGPSYVPRSKRWPTDINNSQTLFDPYECPLLREISSTYRY